MVGFRSDFRPIQLRGVLLSQFTDLRNFRKLIFRISTSDETHFGQKRQFRAIANGDRISGRFPLTTITRDFRFSNFTALRIFSKSICRIATSDESHLGQNDNFAKAPTVGGPHPDFAHYNYEGVPIIQFYGFTELFAN